MDDLLAEWLLYIENGQSPRKHLSDVAHIAVEQAFGRFTLLKETRESISVEEARNLAARIRDAHKRRGVLPSPDLPPRLLAEIMRILGIPAFDRAPTRGTGSRTPGANQPNSTV